MAPYVSLYRRYRPQSFGDVVGQGHITRILQNALEGGRIAHAYLFCGPRGTGKTTTARLLAKALNCANGPARDPCNACPACERITAGSSLDVIEIDAASNRGIDDIRELREKVKYAPAEVRHKVYVIDECHMLTTEAFNALLKTIEEPPPHVLFILATTDPQKVPATILSRCQRMDFRRGSVSDLAQRLRAVASGENLRIDEEAITLIARAADGSWRDGLSILEQIVAFGAESVTGDDVRSILGTVSTDLIFRTAQAIASEDATTALQIVARLSEEGKDIRDFLRGLIAHFRNLLLVGASNGAVMPDGATPDEARVLGEQASRFPSAVCIRAIEALSDAEKEMRRDSQHRLLLEIALMRLVLRPAAPPAAPAQEARLAPPTAAAEPRPAPSFEPRPAPAAPRSEPPASAASAPPAPAARPAPPLPAESAGAAPAPPGEVDLEYVKTRWPLILEQIPRGRLRGVLHDAWPARVTAKELFVCVREGHSFHRDQLEKPENRRVLEEAFKQVLGVSLLLRAAMEGDDIVAGPSGPPPAGSGVLGGEARAVPAAEATAAATPPASADEMNPYDAETMSVKDVADLFHGRVVQGRG